MAAPLGAGRQLAAVDLVGRLAVGQDLRLQVVLHRLLEPVVDVEHDGVADLRCRGAQGAHDVAAGVDREGLAPGTPFRYGSYWASIPETPIWLPWV